MNNNYLFKMFAEFDYGESFCVAGFDEFEFMGKISDLSDLYDEFVFYIGVSDVDYEATK